MNSQPLSSAEFENPALKSNTNFDVLGFMTFDLNLLLMIARYMHYDDFEAIALTCQFANSRFRHYLGYENFRKYVLPAPRFLMEDLRCRQIPVKVKMLPLLGRKKWYTEDAIMSSNGHWLYVLRRSSASLAEYCLDVFERTSSQPLQYRQLHREFMNTASPTLGYYSLALVGVDPREDHPGVYLSDTVGSHWWGHGNPVETNFRTTRQLYTWHLKDDDPRTLQILGERLPYSEIAVKRMQDKLLVYGVEERNCLSVMELGPDNQWLPFDDARLDLEKGDYTLRFSPNTKTLLLTKRSDEGKLLIVQNMKVCRIIAIERPFSAYDSQHFFSITDDGATVIGGGEIFPCNGMTLPLPNHLHTHLGLFKTVSTLSSGTQFILNIGKEEGYYQNVTARKKMSWELESELRRVFQYLRENRGSYLQMANRLLQCKSDFSDFTRLRQTWNLRNPQHIFMVIHELRSTNIETNPNENHEEMLLLLSDVITLIEISGLARHPNLANLPRTGFVELALSAAGQTLAAIEWGSKDSEAVLQFWLSDNSLVPTENIGKITPRRIFWGPSTKVNHGVGHHLFSEYERRNQRTAKDKLIAGLRESIATHHPLVRLSQTTANDVSLIEVLCQSKRPQLDNARHKLIPKGVTKLMITTPLIKNYLLLDALLKKIIKLTFEKKLRAYLNTIRLGMLEAVNENPSLRYNMGQLFTIPFYGNDSVQEALKKTVFYAEFLEHFSDALQHEDDSQLSLGCRLSARKNT